MTLHLNLIGSRSKIQHIVTIETIVLCRIRLWIPLPCIWYAQSPHGKDPYFSFQMLYRASSRSCHHDTSNRGNHAKNESSGAHRFDFMSTQPNLHDFHVYEHRSVEWYRKIPAWYSTWLLNGSSTFYLKFSIRLFKDSIKSLVQDSTV